MANSLQCIHCGYYETPHNHPEFFDHEYGSENRSRRMQKENGKPYHYSFHSCPGYSDGIRHKKDCYQKYCTGDCDAAKEERDWELAVAAGRVSVMIFWSPRTGQSWIEVL